MLSRRRENSQRKKSCGCGEDYPPYDLRFTFGTDPEENLEVTMSLHAPLVPLRGRGASANPTNRFERLSVEADPEAYDPDEPPPRTIYLRDPSRSIIASNDSPDVSFDHSINPYRGCEHGCKS